MPHNICPCCNRELSDRTIRWHLAALLGAEVTMVMELELESQEESSVDNREQPDVNMNVIPTDEDRGVHFFSKLTLYILC
jgi:hypothetical protein